MADDFWRPFGDYRQFGPSRPLPWGDRPGWTITVGGGVIPDLVAGIRAHADRAVRDYSQMFWPATAAVGCVPYFTSMAVADALLELTSCCVVVDKQSRGSSAMSRLATRVEGGLGSQYLYELNNLTLPDKSGAGPTVGPYTPWPEPVELGPVRLAGWQRDPGGGQRPLLHAKMLLLGVTVIGEGEFGEEVPMFVPKRTWLGSANWTVSASRHLEYGIWCDDPALMGNTRQFLVDVLRFSEAAGSAAIGPEPQLVDIEFDDDAFREYVAEHGADPDDPEP